LGAISEEPVDAVHAAAPMAEVSGFGTMIPAVRQCYAARDT
jgi:hypothetical protein